jgi:hypothetical protein
VGWAEELSDRLAVASGRARRSFPSRMQRFEREMVTTLSFALRSFCLDLLALRTP